MGCLLPKHRRRTAAALLVLATTASCSSGTTTSETTSAAATSLTAEISQFRDNYSKQIIEIQLTNNTAGAADGAGR